MGIKGIYKEIGPGKRVSLCKLAVEHLEQTGRPFRLAIDIAIWQFQTQAARGGANPAIRTLFYRLVRLLGLSIQPVFVFDGPNKPVFKRNKRSGRGDGVATAMAKRLIKLFGFQVHDAPGEAEAECALLQQQGIVDAVLSEDVDTIMFGCTRTLRNWSADGTKGSKTPTHVFLYEAEDLRQTVPGLDREGMVLVALMSGGDYIPEGVPGCGVKVACEAAKAGFGKSLCRLKKSDASALAEWKANLIHELRTNESDFFRTRHKSLQIPDSFPNLETLRYYTHPVVSQAAQLENLKQSFPSTKPIDIHGLRAFVGETFDWTYKGGAVKLIRVLAPSLLVSNVLDLSNRQGRTSSDPDVLLEEEATLIKAVSKRRTHFSTDATPELRISYVPADVVALDLSEEEDEAVAAYGRQGLALNSDDDFQEEIEGADGDDLPKNASRKAFDPLQPNLAWLPESILKLGVPVTVQDWEEQQRSKEASKLSKTPKRARKKANMPAGAMDKFVRTTKNIPAATQPVSAGLLLSSSPPPKLQLPPMPSSPDRPWQQARAISTKAMQPKLSTGTRSKQSKPKGGPPASKPSAETNPWTIASSQATSRTDRTVTATEAIVISSSPVRPSSSSSASRLKHVRSPSPETGNVSGASASSPTSSPRKYRSTALRKENHQTKVEASKVGASNLPSSQASIKNFASVTKKISASVSKEKEGYIPHQLGPDSDSDLGELEEIFSKKNTGGSSLGLSELQPEPDGGASLSEPSDIVTTSSTRTSKTKLYVPRSSAVGYFKEVEVTRDEADRIMSEQAASTQHRKKTHGKVFRRSDISVVDLTRDD